MMMILEEDRRSKRIISLYVVPYIFSIIHLHLQLNIVIRWMILNKQGHINDQISI